MDEKEIKIALRKTLLAQRDNLPVHEKETLDKQISRKLEAIIHERQPRVVHTYLPFGSEIDIHPLIQSLLDQDIKVICPRSLPKRELENLVLSALSELEEGRFGTKHPANAVVYTGDIDLFIVPGIGFSSDAYRLGYGSGYYDKFFSTQQEGYKAGICYPFQVIDNFPAEPHDIKLDTIIY